jgi:hypothetical protein
MIRQLVIQGPPIQQTGTSAVNLFFASTRPGEGTSKERFRPYTVTFWLPPLAQPVYLGIFRAPQVRSCFAEAHIPQMGAYEIEFG